MRESPTLINICQNGALKLNEFDGCLPQHHRVPHVDPEQGVGQELLLPPAPHSLEIKDGAAPDLHPLVLPRQCLDTLGDVPPEALGFLIKSRGR